MLLGTPSPFQLVSFTHLVYLTDTAFHIFSLAWHLLRFPKLERITVIYGTWVYSNWYILYMPVATFLGLLMFRRNLWGLISWEHLTRMDQIGQLKWYRAWCLSGVGAGWAVAWRFFFGQGIGMAATVVRYRTDVLEFAIWPMMVSNLVMGLILMCWWSFWTFQYQGVVWREDLKEGWAVWKTTTGGVMTGLVTDEELRKSVKDWREHNQHHFQNHHNHNHPSRSHGHGHGSHQPPYSGSTTPQYS
ncbi:hypothetical protein K457DRAFT_72790 [Linnemannia elongata AG-77]|uniref:Uncharacterized protein n=1 Tax=Linnemannia elongata AG-77 TaxID=1314771 RepID=A0A197K2E5_9FUNG|nr:hypothetical protein K457DRAFT_72790 [Linnemannia elongata AG-77]